MSQNERIYITYRNVPFFTDFLSVTGEKTAAEGHLVEVVGHVAVDTGRTPTRITN